MHQLGDERLACSSKNALVTRRKDGSLVAAVWNLVDPEQKGTARTIRLVFDGVAANAEARVSRVGDDSGNALKAYQGMGSPQYPTEEQVRKMNSQSAVKAAVVQKLSGNALELTLEPNALVLVEVGPSR